MNLQNPYFSHTHPHILTYIQAPFRILITAPTHEHTRKKKKKKKEKKRKEKKRKEKKRIEKNRKEEKKKKKK